MKARLGDAVLAEAADEDLLRIEGNWYFPPASIAAGALSESPTPYRCPWKGDAQYFHVVTDGEQHADLAWSYPHPLPTAIERVGSDFSGYVAFDPRVEVSA
ncbi:DUF427 domain-containing protein [Microbacterium sp. cx-55]|uniref:DUF427 domain-containing protein n=1 Tax=Microbacterium sp. cx-55 TaxID=2875948 RepID=UPI001CC11BEE|nr:DUF427 domain-containing protein [Microbacterium sp. cx-55]MBZ4485789.1 DUF427 domain-containing protein [Microbacterium sp. cx-55]UGB34327.1 DUF427 domain-containing protein [Microbacterium sp. cx-55]